MTSQFPRKVGLVVSDQSGNGLDLSQLRIVFRVSAADIDMPPHAIIRVYNLADATAQQVQNEFQKVSLQAGYESGNYGVIHNGSIIRIRKGRESNIDTFVDIMSADLDTWFNFGVASQTLDTNQSNPLARWNAIVSSSNQNLAGLGINPTPAQLSSGTLSSALGTGGTLPRGKVLFGLARARATEVTQSVNTSWSIVNGQLQVIDINGYAPGEAVQINAMTGMIGVPEATVNGIEVKCLLNPLIKTATQIQLNNADITTTRVQNANIGGQSVPIGFPNVTGFEFFASLSADGFYKVLVAEHNGDSRGEEWYTELVCLNIDSSAAPGSAVNAFGTTGSKATF